MLAHEWLPQAHLTRQPAAAGSGRRVVVSLWSLYRGYGASPRRASTVGRDIFARFGAKLENVSVGCCGMAGTYGHEAKNHTNSLGDLRALLAAGDAAPAA